MFRHTQNTVTGTNTLSLSHARTHIHTDSSKTQPHTGKKPTCKPTYTPKNRNNQTQTRTDEHAETQMHHKTQTHKPK